MDLKAEYRRQLAWRHWPTVLEALPILQGTTVLDLGCAIGDLSAALAARGANVIGIDTNESLLAEARARQIPRAVFYSRDLRTGAPMPLLADGLWCSFTAAYFPSLAAFLEVWRSSLRAGAWVALTEIDDLFGHEPLSATSRVLFERYAAEALEAERYDFRMGRKLQQHLDRAGVHITRAFTIPDAEFSFDGPATPEVLAAWRDRLDRMTLLRTFCGDGFDALRSDLLASLQHPEHRSVARVYCVIGTW